MAAISSDLAAGSDVDDGALTYRVWFDKTGRIEGPVIEFVTGPLDDVFAAWGPGASRWFADHQGHFYCNHPRRGRDSWCSSDDPEKKHFTVEARPYVPFATSSRRVAATSSSAASTCSASPAASRRRQLAGKGCASIASTRPR